jgi:hypothetical protein
LFNADLPGADNTIAGAYPCGCGRAPKAWIPKTFILVVAKK